MDRESVNLMALGHMSCLIEKVKIGIVPDFHFVFNCTCNAKVLHERVTEIPSIDVI